MSFYGFPYPTRMAVARLADGTAWIWSPVALTDNIVDFMDTFESVGHIVSPNKIHHLFLEQWYDRWPGARMYAPPGLAQRKPNLRFSAELGDDPDPAWAADIDQVIFRGSLAMEEVVFFHRESRTAIVCDLIQRHPEKTMTGWKGMLMRLDSLVGKKWEYASGVARQFHSTRQSKGREREGAQLETRTVADCPWRMCTNRGNSDNRESP